MPSEGEKQILRWVIDKITNDFPDDISVLVGHGFGMIGSQGSNEHYKSDIDYFIPETPNGKNLARTFIVDHVCYDIYPRTWDSIETMASLEDPHTACLAEARILYVRSEKDREHFETLRQRLLNNLANQQYAEDKARKRVEIARNIFAQNIFLENLTEFKTIAWHILDYLAQAIALKNHRYFKKNSLYILEEMAAFDIKPASFERFFESVMAEDSVDHLRRLCFEMIAEISHFVGEPGEESHKKPGKHAYRGLADWYQEFCHMWRELNDSCEAHDIRRVFAISCELQSELNVIREEFGLEEMDLLSAFSVSEPGKIADKAKCIEEYIVSSIVRNSIQIAEFEDVHDFMNANW